MLSWFTAASWAVKIGIVVGILAAFFGFGWLVYHTLHSWGYNDAVAELTPKITKANLERDNALKDTQQAAQINEAYRVELGRLDGIVKVQNASIADYKLAVLNAEIKLRAELVKIVAREKRLTTEVARLLAIANSPVITEGACDEADAILRSLMRDRVRDPA